MNWVKFSNSIFIKISLDKPIVFRYIAGGRTDIANVFLQKELENKIGDIPLLAL